MDKWNKNHVYTYINSLVAENMFAVQNESFKSRKHVRRKKKVGIIGDSSGAKFYDFRQFREKSHYISELW